MGMRKVKILLSLVICSFLLLPLSIQAKGKREIIKKDEIVINQQNDSFTELTREEFIEHIARNNGISYEQAEIEVTQKDFNCFKERSLNGEIQPRSMILHYGYFESYFYTPTDEYNDPRRSTCAKFGVYASYYYPDADTSWASRRFNAVHDTYLYAANDFTSVILRSKYAYVSGSYSINFDARFEMKRDAPFMYYVEYTMSHKFYI